LTACAANATTIAIHGIARFGVPLPSPAAPIGFRDVVTETNGFEIDKRLIAVIALISDDVLETVTVRPHSPGVRARSLRRPMARPGV
jgi:hypothetical protein